MKKHLNTLYITSDDSYVHKERETFVVEIDNKKVFQAPVHSIENIVCFGFKALSLALMAFCAENNVGISYLSENGRFLARISGPQQGNVLLRKAQYVMADNEPQSLLIARPIIAAKVANYRNLLLRHQRNHPESRTDRNVCPSEELTGESESELNEEFSGAVKSVAAVMGGRLPDIQKAETLDELRGLEGECAAMYFGVLSSLIAVPDFEFTTRSKRPPLDPANALLSFLYSILANDVRSAVETTGLDPQVGFLHRLRSGRPSLALDIMEEFRAYLGDRIMLNLINLKQVGKKDFEIRESGEVRMSDEARKTVLTAYQKRKQEEITHPFLGEKMTIGLLPHIQAQLMARYIRGDIQEYPPFYIK
ncbi:MAG: type I-C CRISPR-associated endonuclease Cas1c [Candidatus Kryptoniota bacterium]